MKHILVCVKAVPVSSSVEVDGQHRLKRDGVSLQWNIADESALEAAFRLADKDGSVTVLTMGPPKLEGPLLELLARGANLAVLFSDRLMAGADTRGTARTLASAAEKLGPVDAVCCGCCLQLSSKSTACSLSHFSVCFGVMPAGGCTVCCMDLSLFPAQS